MLNAAADARKNGETLPVIVQANYWPDPEGSEACTDSDRRSGTPSHPILNLLRIQMATGLPIFPTPIASPAEQSCL